MKDKLNKKRVMIEILEKEPLIILMKRKKFVKAKVLQVRSEVETIKAGDIVMCYNEGNEIKNGDKRGRIIFDQAVVCIL